MDIYRCIRMDRLHGRKYIVEKYQPNFSPFRLRRRICTFCSASVVRASVFKSHHGSVSLFLGCCCCSHHLKLMVVAHSLPPPPLLLARRRSFQSIRVVKQIQRRNSDSSCRRHFLLLWDLFGYFFYCY